VSDTEVLREPPGAPEEPSPSPRGRRRGLTPLEGLALGLLLLIGLRTWIGDALAKPALETWSTIFVSISVQALPFLVLGVSLSGAIAAFVPASWLSRVLPKRALVAVPTAGLAGILLPGCECGSVPIAGRLVARDASPPAALAFMLSAPAINPIVLTSTAVAFPGQPRVVIARFVASLATAIVVGLLWARLGREDLTSLPRRRIVEGATRWQTFHRTALHDFLHAGGYLVVGAAAAATLHVVVPASWLDSVASSGFLSVIGLAVLAVVLCMCSEADAFVAASLSQFSMAGRLAFMVVGPAVDLKLIAMQAGTFGRPFAVRFAPLAFVVATSAAVLTAWWLL